MSSQDPAFPSPSTSASAGYRDEIETEFFSLAVVAELAGVNTRTVLHYQEQGFIRSRRSGQPSTASAENTSAENVSPSGSGEILETETDPVFDTECLRQLRRMEHLRETCGVNDAGLRLILRLLEEVEQLRQERRQPRH